MQTNSLNGHFYYGATVAFYNQLFMNDLDSDYF